MALSTRSTSSNVQLGIQIDGNDSGFTVPRKFMFMEGPSGNVKLLEICLTEPSLPTPDTAAGLERSGTALTMDYLKLVN